MLRRRSTRPRTFNAIQYTEASRNPVQSVRSSVCIVCRTTLRRSAHASHRWWRSSCHRCCVCVAFGESLFSLVCCGCVLPANYSSEQYKPTMTLGRPQQTELQYKHHCSNQQCRQYATSASHLPLVALYVSFTHRPSENSNLWHGVEIKSSTSTCRFWYLPRLSVSRSSASSAASHHASSASASWLSSFAAQ